MYDGLRTDSEALPELVELLSTQSPVDDLLAQVLLLLLD